MLRLWLPQRQLLYHQLHSNFLWRPRGAASFIFLHHLYTSVFCADRRRRLSASISADSLPTTLQKKSKGQKKREALRSVDWAAEFATFSDSQLRRAIRWGNLKGEVFDAVRVVKKIGRYGKHARTRQLKLIGGMLRAVDPELMEAIIKAIKDGDVEGVFNKSGELNAEDDEDDEDFEDYGENDDDEDNDDNDEEEEDDFDSDDDQQQHLSSDEDVDNMEQDEDTVERWFQGLLSGDSDVVAEVYSIRSASFNRQELRRLVRDALKSQSSSSEKNNEDSSQVVLETPARSTDPQGKLRDYLEKLAVKVQDDDKESNSFK